jgi:hypothetical protein
MKQLCMCYKPGIQNAVNRVCDRFEVPSPRMRERHDSNPLILGDSIWQVCFASNNRERVILAELLEKRVQILAMRFDAAHHAGDTA